MKIYTKTGDKGKTSLYTGKRLYKNDPILEAIGTIDECNSAIGVALSFLKSESIFNTAREQLAYIQCSLFDVGAALATPRTSAMESKIERTRFDQEATTLLEKWIDEMEEQLPKLTAFILPGGHSSGATLHLARSICRRAERLVVPLNQQAEVADSVLIYLNRLSDYLFVASRAINHLLKLSEKEWHKSLH